MFLCAGVSDRWWSAWLLRVDRFNERWSTQVCSRWLPGYVEVGMAMCAGAVFHFFHFKVTVGGAREGGVGGGVLC